MNEHMKSNVRNKLMLTVLIVVALATVVVVATLWAASTSPFSPFGPRRFPPFPGEETVPGDIEFFYTMETVVSVVNTTLSAFLLLIYVNIYRKTRSEFTIGLIIFSAVLFLHAFVSIPLVHRAFGFYEFGLGPFAMLPDVFTCLALAVLLYLTYKY